MQKLIATSILIMASICTGPSQTLRDGRGTVVSQQFVFMTPIGPFAPPGPNGPLYEIAVMNLDGSGFRQITNDGKFKFLPHFSPDATRIAYTKYLVAEYGSPSAVSDLAIYDLASGTETLITHEGNDVQPTWGPTGKRLAYLHEGQLTSLWTIDADGSNPQEIGSATGAIDDLIWGDVAWSSEDWILFSVAQKIDGCFKVRLDKIRPDGSSRTKVTDGGPNCTPAGMEQSGEADPGWSPDGQTIYSSRGFPVPPLDAPPGSTERKLYSFSSDAWYPGKPEMDLSLPSEPSCVEGVPKASPDGEHILLFRVCFDTPTFKPGIYLTDRTGSYRTFIAVGFGPDWAPGTLKGDLSRGR